MKELFSSGEVAKLLGIPLERMFYAERVGKIPQATRLGNGKRIYTEADVQLIRKLIVASHPHRRTHGCHNH